MVGKKFVKPTAEVLTGRVSGNVYAVLGVCARALKRAGHHDKAEEMIQRVTGGEATSYDGALQVMLEYVEME